MPTGYTADVGDGKVTEFADFAMQCARAFGALITMRDDPADAPIPDEFTPSEYHVDALQRAEDRVEALRSMSEDDKRRSAGAAYTEALEAYRRNERKRQATRERYEAMLDQVLAWEPPTSDHVEMKTFMVKQLEESIRFDCDYEWPAPDVATYEPKRWYAEEMARAERDVTYHIDEQRKERERADGRTAWVRALRESLADGSQATDRSGTATNTR